MNVDLRFNFELIDCAQNQSEKPKKTVSLTSDVSRHVTYEVLWRLSLNRVSLVFCVGYGLLLRT